MIEFHSDGATSRPGFHIRGQQMDCAPAIGKATPPDVDGEKEFLLQIMNYFYSFSSL